MRAGISVPVRRTSLPVGMAAAALLSHNPQQQEAAPVAGIYVKGSDKQAANNQSHTVTTHTVHKLLFFCFMFDTLVNCFV